MFDPGRPALPTKFLMSLSNMAVCPCAVRRTTEYSTSVRTGRLTPSASVEVQRIRRHARSRINFSSTSRVSCGMSPWCIAPPTATMRVPIQSSPYSPARYSSTVLRESSANSSGDGNLSGYSSCFSTSSANAIAPWLPVFWVANTAQVPIGSAIRAVAMARVFTDVNA